VKALYALAFCVALTAAHTWPLASNPAVHSRADTSDYNLNVWAVDWVARTLPVDPLHLFDANIFYPQRLTLAYSEPLILQGVLAMPATWLGASPVLSFNLVLLAGFALSAWAMAWLVARDTGSWVAGLVAGSAVAFNAHNLMRLPHIQALHLELLPIVFVAIDRLLTTRRWPWAVLVGAGVALQATASIYLLIFTAWAAVCAWLARMPEWCGRLRETAGWTAVAGVVCATLLLPVLWPYWELSRTAGMTRSLAETTQCAAGWTDYFYTGSRVHFDWWSARFRASADANFPGIVVTALALSGVALGGYRDPRTRTWAAVVAGSVALSMLPLLPGFAWLHSHVPAIGAIRCYSRAGQMALVGMAVLAGYGTARVLGAALRAAGGSAALAAEGGPSLPSPRGARPRGVALGILLLALVNLEATRAPMWYSDFTGIPAIYDRLRDEPNAVAIEMPFYSGRMILGNSRYLVAATRHRKPLVNGYSGFQPRGYDDMGSTLRGFPSEKALDIMRSLGVTHVVVHRGTGQMQRRRDLIAAQPALQLLDERDGIAIFRLR